MSIEYVPPVATRAAQWRLLYLVLVCSVLVCSAGLVGVAKAADQVAADSRETGVRDFVEYWSASRLLLNQGNPYSPDQLLGLQRSVGWDSDAALIMWNPPWTLPFTLPFGLLNFNPAQFAWLFSHLLMILVCTQALAKTYGSSSGSCWIEWCVALSFVPTIFVLIIGQISPMILAGITGFLVFERKGQRLAAGAMLAVVSTKPHLLYLFWVALGFWIWRYRAWEVCLGAAASFVVIALLPLYFSRDVYDQYRELYALADIIKPLDWPAPTMRNIFVLLFKRSEWWLQSLPTLVGFAWLGYYWQRHKTTWRWSEELPLVLLVSVTTSFFAWTYDQVALLPALIEVTGWIKRTKLPWYRSWALIGYVTINSAHMVMRFWFAEEFYYVWLAPALMVTYVIFRFEKQRQSLAPLASRYA